MLTRIFVPFHWYTLANLYASVLLFSASQSALRKFLRVTTMVLKLWQYAQSLQWQF